MERNFELIGYNGSKKIKASLHDAGHILGSAGILIETENDKLFYTGDIKLSSQSLIDKANLPKTKVDILLLETTYGSIDSGTLLSWNMEADAERSAYQNRYLYRWNWTKDKQGL